MYMDKVVTTLASYLQPNDNYSWVC